jgi:hypothetical protein
VSPIGTLHGCAATAEVAGEAGVCGLEATFEGRIYIGNGGSRRIPDYGEPLGAATVPSCGTEPAFEIDAVAIEGIDPMTAFASTAYEDVVFTHRRPEPLDHGEATNGSSVATWAGLRAMAWK